MLGPAARAFHLFAVAILAVALVSGCTAFAGAPQTTKPPRTPRPTVAPDPSPAAGATQPIPTSDPASRAGPPFAKPDEGVLLVDRADIFKPATEKTASQKLADIGSANDVRVVVYTQYKPGSNARSTVQDAKALKLQWKMGTGLVVMWNTTSPECDAQVGGNGQVQLYADSRFAAKKLSDNKRAQILQEVMMPLLGDCEEDDALLAGLDKIESEMRPPTPTGSQDPYAFDDGCTDDKFNVFGYSWDEPFEWYYEEASVPDKYDSDKVLDVLIRSAANVTDGRNDCGLPDRIDAEASYAGTTTNEPCGDGPDGVNSIGFGKLDEDEDDEGQILAVTCTFGPIRSPSEADIIISTAIPWALSAGDCDFFEFDELLEPTITHEFGHVFGLAHVSEEEHGDQTMSRNSNGFCMGEETTLGLGDILGLEELY